MVPGRVGSYPPSHHVSKALYTYRMPACHDVECRALSLKLSVPIQAMLSYQRTEREAHCAVGHSSNRPKGGRNPICVTPRHVLLTIFLSFY